VVIAGGTHVSSVVDGIAWEAPGAVIKIVASSPEKIPKITWAGVTARIHPGGETGGPAPILVDATNGVTIPNGTASGTYGPLSDRAGTLHHQPVAVANWTVDTGTPALGLVGSARRQALLFDAAALESVAGQWEVPDGWLSMRWIIRWVNAGAGSGNVDWVIIGEEMVAGTLLTAADTLSWNAGSSVAGAQDALVETATSTVDVVGRRYLPLRLRRVGTNVTDTLGNDAGVVGLIAERVT
jgi:hypothetical protein